MSRTLNPASLRPAVPMLDVNAVVSWASSLDDIYKDPGLRRDRPGS